MAKGKNDVSTTSGLLDALRNIVSVDGLEQLLVSRKEQLLLPVEQHNLRCAIECERQRIRSLLERSDGDTSIRADQERLDREMEAYRLRHTDETFAAAWADPNLSRFDNTMRFKQLGRLRFVEWLIDIGNAPAETDAQRMLRTTGCFFFDGTALKSLITAAGTQIGSDYLKLAAKILSNPEGDTAKWIRDTHPHFAFQTYSAGGDEFICFFRSELPVSDEDMREMIMRFQSELASSAELRALVDFDREDVILRYADLDEDEKAAMSTLSEPERSRKITDLRARLPKRFEPHFSGGYALLEDAMKALVHHDPEKVTTLEQAWEHLWMITDELLLVADESQRKNKGHYKALMRERDPDQWYFIMRSPEAERHARRANDLERRIAAVSAEVDCLPEPYRSRIAAALHGETHPVDTSVSTEIAVA